MNVIRYFFVGGISASVDIGLFYFFAGILGWSWIVVSFFTFIFATFLNYYLSITFVFQSGTRHRKSLEIIGVFMVSGLALIVNQVVLYVAISILGWHLLMSKIIATGIVFFWNYLGRSKFIF